MATLIFLGTIITVIIFLIRLINKIFKHEATTSTIRILTITVLSYSVLWCVFYFLSKDEVVPYGTDICFDDWCATITQVERPKTLGKEGEILNPKGQFIVVHLKISNKARGIAQKPSEPRVFIFNENGNSWAYSPEGQKTLEKDLGVQTPIDERLELNQTFETRLVFDIPADGKGLKAVIEEGPFITKLLFNEDREVFLVQ